MINNSVPCFSWQLHCHRQWRINLYYNVNFKFFLLTMFDIEKLSDLEIWSYMMSF